MLFGFCSLFSVSLFVQLFSHPGQSSTDVFQMQFHQPEIHWLFLLNLNAKGYQLKCYSFKLLSFCSITGRGNSGDGLY